MKNYYTIIINDENCPYFYDTSSLYNTVKEAQEFVLEEYENGNLDNDILNNIYIVEIVPLSQVVKQKITFKKVA